MVSEKNTSLRSRLKKINEIEREQGLAVAERSLVELIREEASQAPEAFVALSRLLMKGRKFDDALRAAQKARALAPMESEPHVLAGLIQLRQKDNAGAGDSFARALQIDPKSAKATLGAAAVKMAAESYDDALALCDKVLDLDPSMERAHELIARIRDKQGNTDESLDELRTLMAQDPSNKRALRSYLQILRRDGREVEGVQFLEDQAEANPDDNRLKRALTLVAARSGNAELATAPYREKIAAGTASKADRIRMIMALIEAGSADEARAAIGEMGTQKALKPIVAKLEGDLALKSGNAGAAVSAYETACQAARIDPLPSADAAAAKTPEDLARAWKSYTTKSVVAAARSRRQERTDA